MRSATVGQLDALAELFGEALRGCRPESVAILGVAGGNGLEQIDPAVTRQVYGIDINPQYLEAARQRFPALPGLTLACLDLQEEHALLPLVQMVQAAMLFEHAGMGRCLRNAVTMVAPGGTLCVVLQLPSSVEQGVGSRAPASVQSLAHQFQLIDPETLRQEVLGAGLRMIRSLRHPLPSGKAFWMGIFERPPA